MDYELVAAELDRYADVKDRLFELEVVRSEKLLADFGEWLVGEICGGKLADDKRQKGWDVRADGKKLQVKTVTTPKPAVKEFAYLCKDKHDFDDLAIVILNETYRLRNLIRVSKDALGEFFESESPTWDDLKRIGQIDLSHLRANRPELAPLIATS